MSKNWVNDISKMHQKFGVNQWVEQNKDNKELMREYLMFRVNFLQEELTEIQTQMHDPEEVVDGLVDLCVVAIGTMDAFGIDANKAWDTVHKANMAKSLVLKKNVLTNLVYLILLNLKVGNHHHIKVMLDY